VTVIFTACNFNVNLFPIHSNQKDKSFKGSVKIITITMFLVQGIYVLVSVSTIFMYGSNLADNVLQNIGQSYPATAKVFWESYVMQGLFLVILACHIPYLFFSGKEALLIMVDEIMRRSISLVLSKKALQMENSGMDEMPAMPED